MVHDMLLLVRALQRDVKRLPLRLLADTSILVPPPDFGLVPLSVSTDESSFPCKGEKHQYSSYALSGCRGWDESFESVGISIFNQWVH